MLSLPCHWASGCSANAGSTCAARQILDVGSGGGQIARHLLKYADRDAGITCFDLSLR
jgi:ubiquinone/menaquinone biosynthesis C-methylase UbiE